MEKCPKCGYKVGYFWPIVLMQVAFAAIWFLRKYDPQRKYDWVGDVALMASLIANAAYAVIRQVRTDDLKNSQGRDGAI
jgi:hypothetical protein